MRIKHVMLALALAAIASSASAVDFHGYFREGFGINSKGGSQVCFSVAGFNKARFGNECDLYGEWEFSQTIYKDDAGVEVRYTLMPAYGVSQYVAAENGGSTTATPAAGTGTVSLPFGYGTGQIYVQQNWAGMKLPQLGGATIWAGDRYYKRQDVHSYDWFYYNPHQGHPTVGIEDVDLGVAKMAFAITHYGNAANSPLGAYYMPTVHVYGIPVFENASLQFAVNLAIASQQNNVLGPDPKTSPAVTVDFLLDKIVGGTNKLTFQYGMGSMHGAGTGAPDPLATNDDKTWRLIDQFYYAPTPEFSGAAVAIYEDNSRRAAAGPGNRVLTLELRPAYHFSDYFKFAVDASYQVNMIKNAPAGVDNPYLFKITAAPTLVAGRGYWARPEFRLFATYGKWNTANGDAGTAGAFGTDTNGLTFGAQVEAWW